MPQGSTTCARTMADNVDYQQRGGLRLDDAMAIHAALHTPSVHEVRISTGDLLPIESNEQGVRRCVIGRESARPKGRAKLMAQNPHKQSMAAAKAREGHNITHILPMDRYGHHTLAESAGDWGCIGWNSTTGAPGYPRLEPNTLSKNCAAVLNQADVERHKTAHGKAYTPPPSAPSPTGAAAAATSAAGSAASQLSPPPGSLDRTYLNVPFAEKDPAKQLGARWEPQPTGKWYVPPGLALAPFARWLPLGPSSPQLQPQKPSSQPQPPQPSPQPQPPQLTVPHQLTEKEIACEIEFACEQRGLRAVGGTAAVGPSWQPPTTRDNEEECVAFTGVRTRKERDAEGRKNAVSLDEEEEHDSSAHAASVKVKAEAEAAEAPAEAEAASVKVKAEAEAAEAPAEAEAEASGAAEAPEARETKRARTDAPSTSCAALSAAGAKAETLAAKVGRIREALGLTGSMPVATVLLHAYKELGLPPPEAVPLPAQAAELLQVLGI